MICNNNEIICVKQSCVRSTPYSGVYSVHGMFNMKEYGVQSSTSYSVPRTSIISCQILRIYMEYFVLYNA